MMAMQDEAVAGAIGESGRQTPEGIIVFDPILDAKSRIMDHATVARAEIDFYEEARLQYAGLCQREMELEAGRAAAKQNAALRLMQTVNPLSGEKHAVYSATAAMDSASLDLEYRTYLRVQSDIGLEKNNAYARAEAAKQRAELAIALLKAEAKIL